MSRSARPGAAVAARPAPNLTRRASLNAAAALVDYGVRLVVGLVLAPLLLRGLGTSGYGIWQVLLRLIGHAGPAGGRPGEALKWVVAHGQSSSDEDRKRQQVGNAIAVWAVFLPLVLGIGGVLAWLAPGLVDAPAEDYGVVRLAAGLLVLNLALLGIVSIPLSVLQGENLGYRRLGLSTAVVVVGGGLTVLALKLGWGLPGVAAATATTTVLSGVISLQIVRSQVRWWGVGRPSVATVKSFIGLSWWFLLWNLVMQAVKGSDVIVLGIVGSLALVATYTLTSYVPQAIGDAVFMLISATMPGLGGLVGASELERAARIRAETMLLTWLVSLSAGAAVIVWMPSFLRLWVGPGYDAGTVGTVLIVVMVLQLVLVRVDSNVIDVTLRVRAKVLLGLASAALSAALGAVLLGPAGLGIPGLVGGFIAGRLLLTATYPVLVGRLLGVPAAAQLRAVCRPALATAALLAAATWLREQVMTGSWLGLVTLGAGTAVAALVMAYLLGLTAAQRRRALTRAKRVVRLR